MVNKSPATQSPPELQPRAVKGEKLEVLKKLTISPDHKYFWESIIGGKLGTSNSTVLHPEWPWREEFLRTLLTRSTITPLPPVTTSEKKENESVLSEEFVVSSIGKLVWVCAPDYDMDVDEQPHYELEVKQAGETEFFLHRREDFFDPDHRVTEKFRCWELEHPTNAKKFQNNITPKPRKERKSKKKDTQCGTSDEADAAVKPKRKKIKRQFVGAILADGRSHG